jgi:hypothetical protein
MRILPDGHEPIMMETKNYECGIYAELLNMDVEVK